MIIDNTYFKGEIYIPHAKPSITDDVLAVEDDVLSFIDEYARECLLNCLGFNLFNQFKEVLDPAEPDGIIPGSDEKWFNLLNGVNYVDPNTGDTVNWRGIRFKSRSIEGAKYDKSFLAYYVYFFYERNDYITRSDIGHQKENSKNSFSQSPRVKVVNAWNKFVSLVQGEKEVSALYNKGPFIGIDYMHGRTSQEVSLYKFIEDSNIIDGSYSGFKFKTWSRINQFDL